jgi:hypothetical protein
MIVDAVDQAIGARCAPPPFREDVDGEIEIRQLYELEDFGPSEPVDRFAKWACR